MIRRRSAPAAAVAVLALAALEASAGGGVRPIHEPTTLVQDGSYCVTRNVTGNGVPPLTIDVDPNGSVHVNLNGFTLTQQSPFAPVIHVANGRNINLENGTLDGGLNGVIVSSTQPVDRLSLRKVKISNTAGDGLLSIELRHLQLSDTFFQNIGAHGIQALDPDLADLKRLILADVNGDAVRVEGFAQRPKITADTVNVRGAGGTGLYLFQTGSSRLKDIQVSTAARGVDLDGVEGTVLTGLGIDRVTEEAIRIQRSSAVRVGRAVISSPGRHGVVADPNSRDLALADVMVEGAPDDAIHWGATRSTLSRVTGLRAGLCGLRFTSSSTSNHLTSSIFRGSVNCVGSGAGTTDFHDEGSGNTSQGNNQAPGPM